MSGEAIRISVCHCFACQKRTGSIFGAQARFRREDVSTQGSSREYTRTADSACLLSLRIPTTPLDGIRAAVARSD